MDPDQPLNEHCDQFPDERRALEFENGPCPAGPLDHVSLNQGSISTSAQKSLEQVP
jgi:hypothetical protein